MPPFPNPSCLSLPAAHYILEQRYALYLSLSALLGGHYLASGATWHQPMTADGTTSVHSPVYDYEQQVNPLWHAVSLYRAIVDP